MAKFKATRDGLVGTTYIRAGEVFSLDVDKCPRWAEPVKEKALPAEDAEAPENKGEGEEKAPKPAKKAKGK